MSRMVRALTAMTVAVLLGLLGSGSAQAATWWTSTAIVFASTAMDPAKPIDPDIARNANIYNIWTLGLKTGELRQYTDAVGGNLYTVVVNDGGDRSKIGFISKPERNTNWLSRSR